MDDPVKAKRLERIGNLAFIVGALGTIISFSFLTMARWEVSAGVVVRSVWPIILGSLTYLYTRRPKTPS